MILYLDYLKQHEDFFMLVGDDISLICDEKQIKFHYGLRSTIIEGDALKKVVIAYLDINLREIKLITENGSITFKFNSAILINSKETFAEYIKDE